MSNVTCLTGGSTDEVSHESKPSWVKLDRECQELESSDEAPRPCLVLVESNLVLDEKGRTAWEIEVRMELTVSVTDRPPLVPGRL